MDFTLKIYYRLLIALQAQGFCFQTFEQFLMCPLPKVVILRHDVDKLPENSLKFAQIENQLGICGSYYFRIVKKSNRPEIIRQIAELGHEIGYHYEDLALAGGDTGKALVSFQENLNYFRKFYPVKTICMHGSPLSKWNNFDMWAKYNYHDFSLIGEPYFDMYFNEVFYISDTGRKWNNKVSNIRDKVKRPINIPINSTSHFISLIYQDKLPDKLMINTHPQRWFNGGFSWYGEFLMQNLKNMAKYLLLHFRTQLIDQTKL